MRTFPETTRTLQAVDTALNNLFSVWQRLKHARREYAEALKPGAYRKAPLQNRPFTQDEIRRAREDYMNLIQEYRDARAQYGQAHRRMAQAKHL